MHEYEIRILRADKSTDVIIEVIHLNDQAAIRQARKFAEARPFEVWKDLNCIFKRPPGPRQSGYHPPRPAA